jgi:hypothetical protein
MRQKMDREEPDGEDVAEEGLEEKVEEAVALDEVHEVEEEGEMGRGLDDVFHEDLPARRRKLSGRTTSTLPTPHFLDMVKLLYYSAGFIVYSLVPLERCRRSIALNISTPTNALSMTLAAIN